MQVIDDRMDRRFWAWRCNMGRKHLVEHLINGDMNVGA